MWDLIKTLGLKMLGVGGAVAKYQEHQLIKMEKKMEIESKQMDLQIAKVQGEIERQNKLQTAEIDYDVEALKQTQFSWKDEYALLIVTFPFIGCFVPKLQDYVMKGWAYVSKAPIWWQWTFIGAICVSLGIRWITKYSMSGKMVK